MPNTVTLICKGPFARSPPINGNWNSREIFCKPFLNLFIQLGLKFGITNERLKATGLPPIAAISLKAVATDLYAIDSAGIDFKKCTPATEVSVLMSNFELAAITAQSSPMARLMPLLVK